MSSVFVQILLLLLFIFIGYLMAKLGKADNRHSKLLSVLGFYIFLPANVFKTFSEKFTVEYLTNRYPLLIISAVFVIVSHEIPSRMFFNSIAHFDPRRKPYGRMKNHPAAPVRHHPSKHSRK